LVCNHNHRVDTMGDLSVHHDGRVTCLVLDRPERRNALSLSLMREMVAALEQLPPATEVVVVEAEGPAFSAGHDLAEMVARDAAFYDELFDVCTELMLAIHAVPHPVIAKVQGVATAAGCQLVAGCDLAVAAEDAWFATPGVKIGLFCSTPMVPLTRVIGRRRAMRMLLTGEPIDARTALDWGLVNDVVPADELDRAVDALVAQILRFSPRVIALGKRTFYAQIDTDEEMAYGRAKVTMAANAADADAQEGIEAFLAKREPHWPDAERSVEDG
jgi:enoyl-CoA hydratase/carnithine racemase